MTRVQRVSAGVLAFSLAMTAAVHGQPRPGAAGQASDPALTKTLMDLQRREDEAEIRRDAGALNSILADDFYAVMPNGDVQTKAGYIALTTKPDDRPGATFEYSDVTVRRHGEMAIVNYRVEFKSAASTSRYRVSVVWAKQGDSWRTVTFAPTFIR